MYAANTGLLIFFLLSLLITEPSLRTLAISSLRTIMRIINPRK